LVSARTVGEPRLVGEEGVGADADDLDAVVAELAAQGLKALDLGRADEGEIERIPVQHVPLALVIVAAERLLLALDVCNRFPCGFGLSDHRHRDSPLRLSS
jgi:hypothetical protein